jgi:hypothetical protein
MHPSGQREWHRGLCIRQAAHLDRTQSPPLSSRRGQAQSRRLASASTHGNAPSTKLCAVRFSQRCPRHSWLAFGIATEQAFGGGDVEPSVSRDSISRTAISTLAENVNCTSAVPSHELAGDVFNNIMVVHVRQNSGLRCSLLRLAAETWLIGRMSRKVYKLLWLKA